MTICYEITDKQAAFVLEDIQHARLPGQSDQEAVSLYLYLLSVTTIAKEQKARERKRKKSE